MAKDQKENYLLSKQRLKVTRLDKNLEIAFESHNKEEVFALVNNYIYQTSIHLCSEMDLKEKYYYLISLFISFVQKKGWYVHEVLPNEDIYGFERKEIHSHQELMQFFEEMSVRILQYNKKDEPQNKLIQQVVAFVENHIYDDISLKDAAETIYVNPSYLSRLFSREMGMAFSHYVMERKMLLAKALLQNGEKISVVSHKLAYKDVSYFTKVFRRYWKITPREMLTTMKTDNVRAVVR